MIDRLAERIVAIYPDADLRSTIIIQDDNDGKGARIAVWGDPRPQPTTAQLLAVVLP